MKLKALVILAIIIASLFPVYLFNNFFKRIIRPKESMGRLFLYLFGMFGLVFGYTFLVVLVIKMIFPSGTQG